MKVRLFAPTLVGLLTETGRALALIQVGDEATPPPPVCEVRVVVRARDVAALPEGCPPAVVPGQRGSNTVVGGASKSAGTVTPTTRALFRFR